MTSSIIVIVIAIVISVTSSFIIGALKRWMAKKRWIKGRIAMAGHGSGIELVGYAIG